MNKDKDVKEMAKGSVCGMEMDDKKTHTSYKLRLGFFFAALGKKQQPCLFLNR
jgi:hypothetical protein